MSNLKQNYNGGEEEEAKISLMDPDDIPYEVKFNDSMLDDFNLD
jgi:hypothetical protein